MARRNHYGVTVDSEVPTTGVINSTTPEFLVEDIAYHSVDLGWEESMREHIAQEHNGNAEECSCDFDSWESSGPYLIGYRLNEETNLYEEDPGAEYSAIVGEIYAQITRSQYVSRVALCSPCYPGQGDLDTPGGFLAFTLPPDIWGDSDHLPILPREE